MKTKHLPRTPGIYQIVNTSSGKTYVGSAVDLQKRAHNHQRELRRREHPNPRLQRAWDKSGEDAFEIRVLESVPDKARLVEREQHWIDVTQSVKTGYNCDPTAGSRLGWRVTPEQRERASRVRRKPLKGFLTPDGAEVDIIRPYLFSELTGMPKGTIYALRNGKVVSWKGWSHVNAKVATRPSIGTYEGFIDPDGKPVGPVTNMRQFCLERDLIPSNMHKVYQGKSREHRGWTHANHEFEPRKPGKWRTYHGLINPDGKQQSIANLAKFCRENGLDQATMWKLIKGYPNYRQHKGWTYDPALEQEDYTWK